MTVVGVSFAGADFVARAPGRVNLIGGHTDYNEGYVLPLAIDASVRIAVRRRSDRRVRLFAADLGEAAEFGLDAPPASAPRFAEYVIGVAEALRATGRDLAGFDGGISGDLPIGGGLSSSAALSVAAALAFAGAAGFALDPLETARIARRAENDRVGVPCGIMDPLASAAGAAGHALLVDCRSLSIRPVPIPGDVAIVVLDTGTRRGLVESEYAARRAQCAAAARSLGVPALRDVTPERLAREGARLEAVVLRRARHVVSENARTLRAADALAAGDGAAVGKLLDESHASLRDDYEVSSPALDAIVEIARADPACFGARPTGAGFGGAAVALVRAEEADRFAKDVESGYRRRTGARGRVFPVVAFAGARITRPGSGSDP